MSDQPSHLPPYPKRLAFRLHVIVPLWMLATGLLFLSLMESLWGIEPRWSWLPHEPIGYGLSLVLCFLGLRSKEPLVGPYAPASLRRMLVAGLVGFAVFSAIVVPTAVAHPPHN